MSPLPFSRLLDALRARGLPLGVREYVAFAALWQRLDGATVAELRGASAALLSTSDDEVQLVVATFDELYGERDEPPLPPPPPPPPDVWTRLQRALSSATTRWTLGAAVVAMAGLGVWLAWFIDPSLPPMPTATRHLPEPYAPPSDARGTGIDNTSIPAPPPLPPPPLATDWWIAVPALAVSALATLLVFQRPRAAAAERKRREKAWRQLRGSMPGPATFSLQPSTPPTWFDRRDLEDTATLLGRAFTTGLASTRLDVTRTVRLTIESGGLPRFVFEASSATGALLLLEDVAPEMEAWRAKTAAFVAALARQGIRLDRWVFEGTPAMVGRDLTGERVTLDALARRSVSNGVLIISSGSGLAHELEDAKIGWHEALSTWTRRSWLNPVVSPAAWRAELASMPVNVWPFTGNGVLEAAADLTIDPDGRRGRRPAPATTSTVLADDVERLKRLVAVAGQPSLELVEVLRRRFIPDAPEDTVLWVLREAAHGSLREVRLPEAAARRLVAAERRENPERERAVRALVLELLASQPQPAGSVAALRWELAVATQRLALAQLGGDDTAPALAELQRLSQSPIWDEVDASTHVLVDAGGAVALGPTSSDGRLSAPAGLPAGTTAPASTLSWLSPRPLEFAIAAVVAALVTGGLQVGGALAGAAIPHVTDAYRLDFAPATLDPEMAGTISISRTASAANAPATVQLYRDGEAFGDPLVVPVEGVIERSIAAADARHHFQARAVLPDGNLALSNSTWLGPSLGASMVSVNALPWAIGRILDAQGRQQVATGDFTTPFVISLLPGRYVVELAHPDYGTVTQPVDVQAGSDAQVRVTMPGYDAGATAQRLAPAASKQ